MRLAVGGDVPQRHHFIRSFSSMVVLDRARARQRLAGFRSAVTGFILGTPPLLPR